MLPRAVKVHIVPKDVAVWTSTVVKTVECPDREIGIPQQHTTTDVPTKLWHFARPAKSTHL